MKNQYSKSPFVISIAICMMANSAYAQDAGSADGDQTSDVIIVTGERFRGAVETDIPPVEQLETADIEALGASSLTDVLDAVSPQTGSGRGRGSGPPVILLNGQRISGFRELRDLPPEAIQRVQIFPEEVALQYGFRPDQRVVNFILKDGFSSFSAETDNGRPEKGGFWQNEVEATFTSIGKNSRLVLDAEFERAGYLTENERDIVPASSVSAFEYTGDIGEFRSLSPATNRFEVNGTLSRNLGKQSSLSLNANYQLDDSSALLGLPSASLLLPGSSPFSPDGNDRVISRYFDSPRPLERDSRTHTANFGFSFNSLIGDWRWALTGDYGRVNTRSNTWRNADFTALQAAMLSGDANPYADDFGGDLLFRSADIAESKNRNLILRNTLSGELFSLPAGAVRLSFAAGYNRQSQDSQSVIAGNESASKLKRSAFDGSVNIDIPISERGTGTLGFLGDFAINGNFGITELSDFSRLYDYTAGLRWSPIRGVTLTASLIGDDNAPSIGQLGAPLVTTPNVAFYDFTNGETVLIDQISGGNPALLAEKRRDLKIGVNIEPAERLNIQIEYFRNKSSNISSGFPLLTPAIEAAFPGRVLRAVDGTLLSVDSRPVNFAEERSQSIRWGFNFSGSIGPDRRGGPGGRFGRGARGGPGNEAGNASAAPTSQRPDGRAEGGRGRPPSDTGQGSDGQGSSGQSQGQTSPASNGTPPATGRSPQGGGPGFGGGPPSRWRLAIYHTYQIQDEILIAPGITPLDRLDGDATSFLGGTPRHKLEISGGAFYNGLGLFLEGNYRSATRAKGSGLPGSSDLTFSDLATINLRTFINLDNRGKLTEKVPFLKGSRIAFRIDNLLGDVINVRDENGQVPLSYQPGYLDPRGRFFEISFRKRF